jgi:voltage-gated potassium channel
MDPDDRIMTAFVLIFILLTVGTVAYSTLESWSYVDSFYFTAMTITTVGYGDLVPTTDVSKLFTVFFSFTGISIALVILVSLGKSYYDRERRAIHYRIKAYMERKKAQKKPKHRKKKVTASRRQNLFNFFK